jgi:hypothetical protein
MAVAVLSPPMAGKDTNIMLLLLLLLQIMLDFNGHTTNGTKWNTGYFNGLPFDSPAYDIDGNTSMKHGR